MTPESIVLILDRDAEDYAERLADLGSEGVGLAWAAHADALPEEAGAATVVLGEPAMIVKALDLRPELVWAQSTWAGVTPLLPLARSGVVITGVKDSPLAHNAAEPSVTRDFADRETHRIISKHTPLLREFANPDVSKLHFKRSLITDAVNLKSNETARMSLVDVFE